jgi:thymidylate synthase
MRIYQNAYELMSEMGRDLWEMGKIVKPKTYQNKVIEGDETMQTRELISEQYCLMGLPDPKWLFIFSQCRTWANAELKERLYGNEQTNPGEAWKLRMDMWEQFLTADGKFDYTYPERLHRIVDEDGNNNLDSVIQLLKDDPDTRKAVISIYEPHIDAQYYDGSHRIPCSMYYDFLIREGRLNIVYHQRSSDYVQHFGDDVYLAWRLMEYVAEQVGIQPGYLYHCIDSLHSYKKDWWRLKTEIDDFEMDATDIN